MAVVLGVNAGFVAVAPSADPNGTGWNTSNRANAVKDISPVGATKITEIGWYCNNSTSAANFEVGLYDDGGTEPDNLLEVSRTNAKGTGSGWKSVAVDWEISGETAYFLAYQLDTSSGTQTDYSLITANVAYDDGNGTLLNPWGTANTHTAIYFAIYAVYEIGAAGVTRKIKISGTFQDKPIKTKVAGTFEDKPIKIKVGGTFQDA